jgi:hypothetical protein
VRHDIVNVHARDPPIQTRKVDFEVDFDDGKIRQTGAERSIARKIQYKLYCSGCKDMKII